MEIYCTICCKEKRNDKESIEAIKRYLSNRIRYVYEKSKKDHVEFRILSGTYGLLKPNKKIVWYDYLLTTDATSQLKEKIKQQISSQNIDKIIFFAKSREKVSDWRPYYQVIEVACSELDIILETEVIGESSE